MPTINSRPEDRFKPGDRIIFKGCYPLYAEGKVLPSPTGYDGQILTVEKAYISRVDIDEAYYLRTDRGDRVCYYTSLCDLAPLLDIPGDNDDDCV